MSTIYYIEFDEEFSELYQEVVHFHFDKECPICHKEHAGTNMFCSVMDCVTECDGEFCCTYCLSDFKIIKADYTTSEVEVILIKDNYNK